MRNLWTWILWVFSPTAAFRRVVDEAAAAGTGWHTSYGADMLLCANGRCLLGALIAKRALGDYSSPIPGIAAKVLQLPYHLCVRLANANDDRDATYADRQYALQAVGL